MTRFTLRHFVLIFTFLFLLSLSVNAPAWAGEAHQTIPTVTPGGGGLVPLPEGLNTTPTLNSANNPLTFTQLLIFVVGGSVILVGIVGGGLYLASWLGWFKFPK